MTLLNMTDPTLMIQLVVLAGLGLLLGSFLGVVIHRGPIIWGLAEAQSDQGDISLSWPPSHCPTCGTRIGWPGLLPLLGYFLVRRRCVACKAAIPRFYPIVEALGLISGITAALLFSSWAACSAALGFFLLLIALSAIDQRTGYLPDALTLPLMTLGIGAGAIGLFVSAEDAALGWVFGWGALAALGALYRAVRGRDGLGGGDAKLLGAGAAFTGPMALPVILLLAAASALLATLLMGKGKVDATHEVRFGPWLSGAIAAIFIARNVWPGIVP